MQRYGTFIDAPETGSLMDIDNRTADMSRRVDFEEHRGCRCSSHSAKCCKADGTEIQHRDTGLFNGHNVSMIDLGSSLQPTVTVNQFT